MSASSSLPSIRELLAAVFRSARLLLVALLVPPIIAVALAYVLPPVYQADAKVLIKPGREFIPVTNMGQSDFGGPSSSMAEVVKSETEILNSKDLAQETLSKLTVGAVYPDLAAGPDQSGAMLDRAITQFGRQLRVDPVELSNVVEVSFQDKNPDVAKAVLSQLLSSFEARHVTLYSTGLTAPIEAQIAEKQKELQELDAKRVTYQNANGAFSIPDQRASLIQQRAQVSAQLQDAQIKEGALQEQITFLKKSRANTPQSAQLQSETDPASTTSSNALQQLMALQQKEQELLQHYQPTAPAVVQIRAQIAQAEQFVRQAQSQDSRKVLTGANPLLATIDQQLLAAQSELTPIDSQIAGYKGQLASIDDQLKKLQESELQVDDLQRQIESLTADLQTLRTDLEQSRLAQNMDQAKVSSVTVIDAPRVDTKPVFPKKLYFGLGGLVLGIALAGMIVLLSLTLSNTIITVEGAERIFGKPVVAALPNLKSQPAQ
ncbi:MAG TPA: Wzz/FepE/Etk N-terminal domain-containing protein [Candidatus Cybelea sp.]|nr:Wzz/FepE/Etk N-terminal domain-containing protein [Candidatus Cybelea sp.]